MAGFVSFVSSGPGDPELLTLKAVDRLERADAVLFDDLSSGPILSYAKASADLIGVGKRADRASPKQHAVTQLLLDYAKAGGRVVRLKSGDGGLFGRLEEELVAMRDAGIEYEIIPGVPSAFAAAAVAGIPLTRRLVARRIQFVTGHDIKGNYLKILICLLWLIQLLRQLFLWGKELSANYKKNLQVMAFQTIHQLF